MRIPRIAVAMLAGIGLFASAALAREPVKGANVTLGKNPGGGAIERTTDPNGVATFGVQAAGKYEVVVTPARAPAPVTQKMSSATERKAASASKLSVEVQGAKGGSVQAQLSAQSGERQKPISFDTDGKSEIKVTVSSE